jgi:hypothetical protein
MYHDADIAISNVTPPRMLANFSGTASQNISTAIQQKIFK